VPEPWRRKGELIRKTRNWKEFLLELNYLITNLCVIIGIISKTCASAGIIYFVKKK
jgi:hypothetical protein